MCRSALLPPRRIDGEQGMSWLPRHRSSRLSKARRGATRICTLLPVPVLLGTGRCSSRLPSSQAQRWRPPAPRPAGAAHETRRGGAAAFGRREAVPRCAAAALGQGGGGDPPAQEPDAALACDKASPPHPIPNPPPPRSPPTPGEVEGGAWHGGLPTKGSAAGCRRRRVARRAGDRGGECGGRDVPVIEEGSALLARRGRRRGVGCGPRGAWIGGGALMRREMGFYSLLAGSRVTRG
jgi:hypothetical protein